MIIVKAAIVEQQVDALIKGGYYSNREEFIGDAIRTFFELRKEMKIAAVVEIYKKEELSISKAAEPAGVKIHAQRTWHCYNPWKGAVRLIPYIAY